MKYSKEKSEKLVKEFNYLVGENYYPFGKKGRVFKVKELKSKLPEIRLSYTERAVHLRENPNYLKEKEEENKNGENWRVKVIIKENEDILSEDLETVLKVLKIRHDIGKLFNS